MAGNKNSGNYSRTDRKKVNKLIEKMLSWADDTWEGKTEESFTKREKIQLLIAFAAKIVPTEVVEEQKHSFEPFDLESKIQEILKKKERDDLPKA